MFSGLWRLSRLSLVPAQNIRHGTDPVLWESKVREYLVTQFLIGSDRALSLLWWVGSDLFDNLVQGLMSGVIDTASWLLLTGAVCYQPARVRIELLGFKYSQKPMIHTHDDSRDFNGRTPCRHRRPDRCCICPAALDSHLAVWMNGYILEWWMNESFGQIVNKSSLTQIMPGLKKQFQWLFSIECAFWFRTRLYLCLGPLN